MKQSTLLLLTVCIVSELSAAERPRAIRAMEEARKAIVSGRIEWNVIGADKSDSLAFVSRYASNGDMIFEERGNEEGWTIFDSRSGAGVSRYPQCYLVNGDGVWHHQESGLNCRWWKRDGLESPFDQSIRDPRALGAYVTANSVEYTAGLRYLGGHDQDPVIEWDESQHGDLFVVTGKTRSGGKLTWYIDSARGWNPERVEYDNGDSTWTCVCALDQFGDTWFPRHVRYYRDGQLKETVVVRTAEFDGSSNPKRFTPTDLGVEPGSSVSAQNLPPASGKDLRTWNGDGIVRFEDWAADVKSGKREPGPRHQQAARDGVFRSPYDTPQDYARRIAVYRDARFRDSTRRHELLWERYVRDFIARYRLDDGQTQKAWTFWRECRHRAEQHFEKNRREFSELYAQREAALEARDEEETKRVDARWTKLTEPVDRIFEKELKPRLEALPTRKQRAEAEQQSSSQPARP